MSVVGLIDYSFVTTSCSIVCHYMDIAPSELQLCVFIYSTSVRLCSSIVQVCACVHL